MRQDRENPIVVITGASSGIGRELALLAARDGWPLLLCADEPAIHDVAATLPRAQALEADLSTREGADRLLAAIGARPVAMLMANAGIGLGGAFLDQDIARARNVVDLNVSGTLALIHPVGCDMRRRGTGRILVTGSIAGALPGSFQAVYNGTKAFLDSFALALRDELEGSGVTVTCLMPGPTETRFFQRAGMEGTAVGQAAKADATRVAQAGYAALLRGDSAVVPGVANRLQRLAAGLLPEVLLARMHRRTARPWF